MLLRQKTNSLFYGKWPYKISCKIESAYLIRTYGKMGVNNPSIIRGHNFDPVKLREFVIDAKYLLEDSTVKKRINHNYIDFYLLNKDYFNSAQFSLTKYIKSITQPESDDHLTTLLENKKYILCDKLPHGKYQFKITFKDMPVKVRNDLINWAEKYNNNEIYIPKSTRTHFKSVKYHYGSHYFYITDTKMITLIAMASSGYIRRTDEYVIRNSINIESK